MSSQCTVLLEPPLQLNLPAPLLSGLWPPILWHLAQPAPLSPRILIFISEVSSLIPDGSLWSWWRGREHIEVRHILGTLTGPPLPGWQMSPVTFSLSHDQAEDISHHVKHAKFQDAVSGLVSGPGL